jgi:hypothetical protein
VLFTQIFFQFCYAALPRAFQRWTLLSVSRVDHPKAVYGHEKTIVPRRTMPSPRRPREIRFFKFASGNPLSAFGGEIWERALSGLGEAKCSIFDRWLYL